MTEKKPTGESERKPTGEIERKKRAAAGKLLAAVIVALPGAYAAVRAQSAADVDVVQTEVTVRDRQEKAIQKHVESLRREIAAVKEAAVTHKELLKIIMKLREREDVRRTRTSSDRRESSARERDLEHEIEALRRREVEAEVAAKRAIVVQRKLPKLKPSRDIRESVKRAKGL
jgi:hypothetical protein